MKAVVYTRYGPPEVLQIKEVAQPTPGDDEVLIKVFATSVTKYDTWMRSSTAPPGFWLPARIDSGIRKPKQPVLGTDLAGKVEAVGSAGTQFQARRSGVWLQRDAPGNPCRVCLSAGRSGSH